MDNTALWNRTAAEYQRVFRLGQSDYNRAVLAFWEAEGLLRPGDKVLDVGCGVGKYAVLLAARGCDVTLLDNAAGMLRFAAANMVGVSTPWRTALCDFRAPDGTEPALRARYDFVFSTMSPAIADASDLARLDALAVRGCFVSRFSAWSQPLRDAVLREAGLEPRPAHGDMAADCAALLEAARTLGYGPQTRECAYDWEDVRSAEAMAESLLRRLPEEETRDAALYERLLAASRRLADGDGLLRDAVHTRAFWLWWKK